MYGCQSWTIKKAERQRIDVFNLCCWRRLSRVPWTVRRSNQSILKEINPEYSLEGLILKLKLQYFSHLMWRVDPLEKTLMLGKIGGRRRRGQQSSNLSILKEINSEYSLEGLILKLKFQYFDHLMWRVNSLEKTPMLGKIEIYIYNQVKKKQISDYDIMQGTQCLNREMWI